MRPPVRSGCGAGKGEAAAPPHHQGPGRDVANSAGSDHRPRRAGDRRAGRPAGKLSADASLLSQFHFTFPSAKSGRYPNNSPFSINEILDPAILDVVYDQLDLGKYEVDHNQFYGSFYIRPFVLAKSEIAERFRQQLADRRLSFVERERLEQQLKIQLAQASRGAAELAYIPQRGQ